MTHRRSPAFAGSLVIAAVLAAGGLVRAVTDREPAPLALVGPDTLTTADLRIELSLMDARNTENVPTKLDDPAAILKRLTQNQLLVQEGYRMGLDQEFTVRNQALEVVRSECMKVLLDSVALSIPDGTSEVHEKRRLAVQSYLDGLAHTYGVVVDSTVLATLDYGSADPAVQKRLRESREVLVRMPSGHKLSVADFSRELRFTEFHGLVGKADAAERRDAVLREYVARNVVGRQLKAQKMDRQPQMELLRLRFERSAMLEEVLRVLTQIDFAPTDAEVSHYYREHVREVTGTPRVKLSSLKVPSKEIADDLRAKVLKGATIRWLTANDKRVIQGAPPFPESWLQPEQMGLKPADLQLGHAPEPYQVPDGWVVCQIVDVQPGEPLPLEQCRDRILGMMRRDATRQQMIDSLARLEAESPVVILPGAEAEVARVVAETKTSAEPAASPETR